jgi:hypothetical protein
VHTLLFYRYNEKVLLDASYNFLRPRVCAEQSGSGMHRRAASVQVQLSTVVAVFMLCHRSRQFILKGEMARIGRLE